MKRQRSRRRRGGRTAPAVQPTGVEVLSVSLPPQAAAAVGRPSLSVLAPSGDVSVVQAIRSTGWWEPHVMEAIIRWLPPGGTFVDVGAHIGVHAVLGALRAGASGSVLALEASPVTHALLARNLAGAGCPGALALNIGAWDGFSRMSFRHLTAIVGGSHVTVTGQESPWEAERFTILCAPLDSLVSMAGLNRVDLMKVDVEGAEFKVLQGARGTLARYRPPVILEFNPVTAQYFDGRSARDLYRQVREFGYRMEFISPDLAAVPVHDYGVLEQTWARGPRVVDVICLPE